MRESLDGGQLVSSRWATSIDRRARRRPGERMLAIFGAIRGAVKTSWRRFGDSSSNDDRMHLPVSPELSHIQVAPVQPGSAGSPIIGAHPYVGPHIERPLSLSSLSSKRHSRSVCTSRSCSSVAASSHLSSYLNSQQDVASLGRGPS